MQILDMIVDAVKRITSLIWVLLTISVLLEVLGVNFAFKPISNLNTIATQLGGNGLTGIVAAFIAWHIATGNR